MSHDITPPPMPGYGPPMPPQPPRPPGGNRTNLVIVGCAVAVVASVIGTGVVVMNDGDGTASPAPRVTVTKTVAAEDAGTTGDDSSDSGSGSGSGSGSDDSSDDASDTSADTSADDDGVFALDDTVIYDSDVEVTLSGFKRGVSSEYASPENTPYAKFTIKIVNGSDVTVDANEMTVDCAYGDEGKEGEGIYDDGLDGLPDTRILAGRSLTVPWACELPRSETFLQVEVSPDYDSEEAIFTGNVKK
ncbi:hypothetical protein OG920_19325 [Streptomyces europaeiscabiei]|uniref:hypothetical protein n=1 Tax=Streptomyces TaxID=1883 RepID=UPI000A360A49|nr:MULTISPECIES: hypothetical protein [Streptomyces]MDX3587255.1 hypothetical protein [Streptomyces europaeiscabiei]MDX3611916.1 hypothetical protein [Streptomyces europaeiscabiei]MDX3634265.1 hypothetical protein [Streptomyces europaeiscabiei]MDX3651887.1 hypothetical protein [Streptomyces europaeiscabiei]